MHLLLPLAHFWLPLAPFWLTFGVPWLTFGVLSFTFAHPGIHFLTFDENIVQNLILKSFSLQLTVLGQSNRIFPKRIERTPTESTSSLVTHPSRARSGTFAAGNLD